MKKNSGPETEEDAEEENGSQPPPPAYQEGEIAIAGFAITALPHFRDPIATENEEDVQRTRTDAKRKRMINDYDRGQEQTESART